MKEKLLGKMPEICLTITSMMIAIVFAIIYIVKCSQPIKLDFTGFIENIGNKIIDLIEVTGYPGILFLMVLESALMPIPSEIVMPFSGYLVLQGKLNFTGVVLAGSIGNLIGSLLSYLIGLKYGRNFLVKYGKFLLIKKEHLELAEKWFKKYGDRTVLFSRLLPVIRTVISLPAGIGKMEGDRFTLYTIVGVVPWCCFLTYAGILLGKNWTWIEKILHNASVTITILLIAALIVYFLKKNIMQG